MSKEREDFRILFDTISLSDATDDPVADKDSLPEETLKAAWDDEVHRLLKRRYNSDTTARIYLAGTTQLLIFLWMASVAIVLMNNKCFQLPSGVLIAMLGTTTVTVLGLAYIVLKGFFSVMKQDVDLRDHQLKK